jgi:hypothetical protein
MEGPIDLFLAPVAADHQHARVVLAAISTSLMLFLKVGAVSSADRTAVLPAPLHQLPILLPQEPAIPERHHIKSQRCEAVGNLQGDVLVEQDRKRHDGLYLPMGAGGRRSRLS